MHSFKLLAIFSLILTECNSLTPQCRNERGEPVDWFYVYKLPREKNHLNPLVRRGVAYMYLTPSKLRGGWIMSDLAISDSRSMVGKTLMPLYQLPREKNHLNPLVRRGVAYMYLTPSKLRGGWIMSDLAISDSRSMVGKTLMPLYQDRNIISLVYNDQPPATEHQPDILQSVAEMYSKSKRGQMNQAGVKKFKKFKLGDKYYDDYDLAEMCKMHSKFMKSRVESGHTKGVILGDKFTALWLVHSVPRFPPLPDIHGLNVSSYNYPTTGTKYGQSFLCVSVQTSTLNQIATQLKYNEPLIVYYHMPPDFDSELPNLVDVVHNKTIDASPWYHIESFETLVGRKFLSFAKSAMFNDDLYSGLVAEVLQSDLLVESWTNGPGTLDSECTRNFQVRNIERLKFPIAKMSFTSHNDHSKWAVAVAHKMHNSQDTKVADYWVCVGDINRALPQESRGGGTVCTSGPILWGNFAHLIESVQTWYIYKPPSDIAPYLELGRNFTYITSRNAGRWQPSSKYITANSMLQHTLSPIYRPTYTDYLAVAVYEPRSTSQARGVLLADEVGGVWIGHTVPGLIDMRDDRPTFPDSERANGHLLMCLSIDLLAINAIASALQVAAPTFTYVKVPNRMRELLPTWVFENNTNSNEKHTKKVNFLTNSEFLTVEMLAGPPDNEGSLYEEFAASKQLVLDVYSPTDGEYLSSVCAKNFSVRNIETISLKMRESVQYVSYLNDRTRFAVSTAASWQKMKSSPPQYWTCVSNLDKEDTIGKGGLITCVDNYPIWLTFDNFKVKEPECY
ncbi:Deoxyribonuclease-2-alpha [Papilio xuthus]|uniref:Deoxyribonuclease-2-alpha n=1 Tax=Papilio xuthus TaxID=66420 RepID=A0A194PGM8_PAPXU|nr:Deoxyribonuclease-2-alpha [Papilio xuthus]